MLFFRRRLGNIIPNFRFREPYLICKAQCPQLDRGYKNWFGPLSATMPLKPRWARVILGYPGTLLQCAGWQYRHFLIRSKGCFLVLQLFNYQIHYKATRKQGLFQILSCSWTSMRASAWSLRWRQELAFAGRHRNQQNTLKYTLPFHPMCLLIRLFMCFRQMQISMLKQELATWWQVWSIFTEWYLNLIFFIRSLQ